MVGSSLSEEDKARISSAIRKAESSTAGEIYVVVAHAADDFRYVPVIWAALVSLVWPWPLHLLTTLSTTAILVTQAVVFIATAWGLSHPRVRPRIVPEAIAAEAARKSAIAQFLAHGVHLTEKRTGVLIYVALINRRVEIVADVGINNKVAPSAWEELALEVTTAAQGKRLLEGIETAIRKTGSILAEHFPPAEHDRNELSDRVVEI
jgi:putative membrane protein